MTDFEGTSARLAREIENVLGRNPQSRAIVRAFEPILQETQRLVDEVECRTIDLSAVDRTRLQGGVPLIGQTALLLPEDPWDQIARAMIPAVVRGFPALRDELLTLQKAIDDGTIRLADGCGEEDGGAIADRWANSLAVRRSVIAFFWAAVTKPVWEYRRRAVKALFDASGWDKGYCPCCGAFPAVAIIQEKIPQRWLHCSQCGHDWRFSRVICPCCSHENQQEMPYFFVEGKEQETAFICKKCNRYLITINHLSDIETHDPEIWAMGMTHLDLLMQQKGFVPMTVTPWNVFD
ncbi:MAG: formate dehydrogenase accessory protein FdhE [Deltaproteobacteria bacterium]|nr:formate dehydrogenase accessory protein FdhE [Deltaproteobacteria bacterium]